MPNPLLHNTVILVAEDEYFLAEDLRASLQMYGAYVVGPVSTVCGGLDATRDHRRPDAAVLDINLSGEQVFPLADHLSRQGVPFLFTTGYDDDIIPARFRTTPRLEKPLDMTAVLPTLAKIIFRNMV